jgi:hypothetical protein
MRNEEEVKGLFDFLEMAKEEYEVILKLIESELPDVTRETARRMIFFTAGFGLLLNLKRGVMDSLNEEEKLRLKEAIDKISEITKRQKEMGV